MHIDHTATGGPFAVRAGFAPTPIEEASWLGFQLGLDGTPAVPPVHFGDAERDAFERSHEVGHARFIEDCEREHQDWLDREEWAFSDPWDLMSEAEVTEAVGSVVARRIGGVAC